MKNKKHSPAIRNFKFLLGAFFLFAFLFTHSALVFPTEDLRPLIVQGDAALTLQDFFLARVIGQKILSQDPLNFDGYRFVLTYCVATKREASFYEILEAAKKLGVSKMSISLLAARLLFVDEQFKSAQDELYIYETEWDKEHERSR